MFGTNQDPARPLSESKRSLTLLIKTIAVSVGSFGVVGSVNHVDAGVNGLNCNCSCVLGRVKVMPVPGRVLRVSCLALVGRELRSEAA